MWMTGGAAIVLAAVVLVVATLAESDRWSVRPRRTGTVTAEELRGVQLPVAWRGYDRGHVDALLARAANTLDEVQRYGALEEPTDAEEADATRDRASGRPPSFLADAVGEPDELDEPLQLGEEAELDEPPASDEQAPSGEELEDGGGDHAGGLDR